MCNPRPAHAGVRPGDTVEQVEGRWFTGRAVLNDAAARLSAGAVLHVRARHPDGTQYDSAIRMAPRRTRPLDGATWLVLSVVNILVPSICLALGFAAVALRIRSSLAWLLLLMMISFSQLVVEPAASSGPLRTIEVVFSSVAEKTLGIWILLLGIYFPCAGGGLAWRCH